ncbi:SusC/RagA family TonB-linked outer membrane protein [Tannerella forsythia]|jgi:tonB-linked outer membrane protein, susC/ragA family|uniref:SusC/RagA family TonB-linked outer membrane protein n=1 Tax=Tannerella forsythia TaxID=28112 RepID=UPI00094FBCA7|nr:TonB-dependent receptor [Tannerella forsythia]OLQ21125.1 SusC/RagA family TonB-linked outer membrane protein [Tannerella forsythia]
MMHKQSVLKHGMGMAFGLLLTTGVPSFSSYAENVTVAVTQQSRTVSGTVVDEQGVPLLGVNVSVSGTTTGTITDIDGKFTLEVPAGAQLTFSYIGFISQTLPSSNNLSRVVLKEDTQKLQEVVVVGYGTQQKKDITGSVAVVNADELLKTPSASATQQLQGRAAGVVIGSTGSPGSKSMVRIRGIGTVNDNGPLYVIDGVSTRNQNLNSINPNDIESMQVLKDASSAAIYGAEASNGVILITTKKGLKTAQRPKLTYDAYIGGSTTGKKYDVLNATDRLNVEWAAQANGYKIRNSNDLPSHKQFGTGATPSIPNYLSTKGAEGQQLNPADYSYPANQMVPWDAQGTDWWNELSRTGVIQNHQLSLQGGSNHGSYLFSANYYDQEGTVIHQYFRRYQIRANTSYNVRDWLRVGENLTYAWTKDNGLNEKSNEATPYSWTYRASPWVPVYDIQGHFAGSKIAGTGNFINPVADAIRNKDNYWSNTRIFGNIWGEVDFMKDLTFRTSFGIDYTGNYSYSMSKKDLEFSESPGANGLTEEAGFNFRWVWTNTLTFNRTFNEVHKLNLLVGTEAVRDGLGRKMLGYRRNYLYEDDVRTWTLDMGEYNNFRRAESDYKGEYASFGIFGRANYSFADKYLLTATVRRDGVSRFSKSNRYGTFPSVSAAWRLSSEEFMKDFEWLDDLKLRVGYGQAGNSTFPRATNFISTYSTNPSRTNYDFTGRQTSSQLGYRMGTFGNPDTKWERVETTNIGLDATFLEGKFSTNVEWWYKKSTDMLVEAVYSNLAGGADKPYINIGDMKNTGVDFMINYQDRNGDLSWNVNLNVSTYKNEVLKIGVSDKAAKYGYSDRISGPVSRTMKGRPIGEFYGYQIDGFYESEEEVKALTPLGETAGKFDPKTYIGKFKYRDVDGDGKITTNDRDVLGSPHPDFTAGLNVGLGYKGFDFSMFWYACVGNEIFNGAKYFTDFWMFNGNRSSRMRDLSWEPGKKNAILPILDKQDNKSGTNANSYYVEDGTYARMKHITLGYTLPKNWLRKATIENLRFYVQAENLLTITGYKGIDPEVTNRDKTASGGDLEKGIDVGGIPNSIKFIFGVNLVF